MNNEKNINREIRDKIVKKSLGIIRKKGNSGQTKNTIINAIIEMMLEEIKNEN